MSTYKELLSKTKEQKEASLIEANVLEASFSMQESIQSVKNDIALAQIALEKAKVAFKQAEVKAEIDNKTIKGNYPFSAQAILEKKTQGKNNILRAKTVVLNAEDMLLQAEQALSDLVEIQEELFPTTIITK